MSTSILYHAFGLKGIHYESTEYVQDCIVIRAWLARLAIKCPKTLAAYKTGHLNYFEHLITSGPVRNINNKIKTPKREAYGFRDMVYFKLSRHHLHTRSNSLS